MVGTSFLLNLLQFVALVAPALAILMQVVLTIEDDRTLEIGPLSIDELRILQLSLVIILLGGGIIGGQLITAVDNTHIVLGMVLIFGGLPFSAIAVFLMANKAAYADEVSSSSLYEQMRNNFTNAVSIMLVAGIPAGAYFVMHEYLKDWVDTTFSFGIFHQGFVDPSMFLGAGFMAMVVKSLLTVFKYDIDYMGRSVNLGVRNALYLPLGFCVFVAIPYAIVYFVVNPPITDISVSKTNPLLNIPHFWSFAVLYVLLAHDYDPFQED